MNRQILKSLMMAGLMLAYVAIASAQPFLSGSTGADGAYAPTGTGTVLFDPAALGLNAAGDNVFNFTTITIPAGLTVKLVASKVRQQSVTWLATGNVTIAGTLDLSGASATTFDASNLFSVQLFRTETQPGPGGYAGGVGSQGGVAPEAGLGPGGGPAGQNSSSPALCVGGAASAYGPGPNFAQYFSPSLQVGAVYGNPYLVPLYGGSGGGGGWGSVAGGLGGVGGAGGGAIRIVSTTQISVTGAITVNGGNSAEVINQPGTCAGGPGAGGAIHLIAPTVTGNGALTAQNGLQKFQGGGFLIGNPTGFVRFNTTNNNFTGSVDGIPAATAFNGVQVYAASGPLYNVPPNSTLALPTLSIMQINGVTVPVNPQGNPSVPDIQINANTAVTVNIAASNIPLATVVTLRVTADGSADQVIPCAPLGGTVSNATATCSATFPFSISLASLRASW